MAQNLQIDPATRDYLLTPTGSSIPSDRVLEASFIALSIPQNQWLYGTPNQGSKLYTLENVKRTASLEQQIAALTMDAIDRQVIAVGQASAAEVYNTAATSTTSANTLAVIPSETQVSTALNFVGV